MHTFSIPSKIILGEGVIASDGVELFRGYGARALVVTGKHVGESSMFRTTAEALRGAGLSVTHFDGITGEPTLTMIADGVEAYKQGHCDVIVGLGGGSALDAAKAIAASAAIAGSLADMMGREICADLPPVIAIPTTAGTGSEATKFTIITDEVKGVKMLLKGDVLLPKMAIVDYTFGIDAPQSVTASTGLDALTHAIEAYISRKASPLTGTYALSAIKRIMKFLPRAFANAHHSIARREMAIAALEAGICINNSSVTVVHGMSRPIGALFHVPHGISNAMLLPYCLKAMKTEAYEKYEEIATALNVDVEVFLDSVAMLVRLCKVPTLREWGIDEKSFREAISKMSRDALESGSPANAPKQFSTHDIEALYLEAYGIIH